MADRDGLDGVSMKSVAAELGMTPMSLYRYVDSKEQLLEVMLDAAYGPADLSIVSSGPWRERLTRWAWALADALVLHPWISATPMTTPPLSPNIIGWTEAGARSFEGMALTNQQKMSSLLVVDGYVRSHVAMSVAMGFTATDAPPPDPYVTILPRLLDPDRFPALFAASPAITDENEGEDFFRDEMRFGPGPHPRRHRVPHPAPDRLPDVRTMLPVSGVAASARTRNTSGVWKRESQCQPAVVDAAGDVALRVVGQPGEPERREVEVAHGAVGVPDHDQRLPRVVALEADPGAVGRLPEPRPATLPRHPELEAPVAASP